MSLDGAQLVKCCKAQVCVRVCALPHACYVLSVSSELQYKTPHPLLGVSIYLLHTFLPDTNNLQGETGCDGYFWQLSAHGDFATGAFTGCVLMSFGVQVDMHGKCC